MENAGEFIGDIAAAGDQDPLGKALQMEDLVGGDAVLGTGHEQLNAATASLGVPVLAQAAAPELVALASAAP